jgi:hypothetical protein
MRLAGAGGGDLGRLYDPAVEIQSNSDTGLAIFALDGGSMRTLTDLRDERPEQQPPSSGWPQWREPAVGSALFGLVLLLSFTAVAIAVKWALWGSPTP